MYNNLSYGASNTGPSDSSKSPYAKRQIEPKDGKKNGWEHLDSEASECKVGGAPFAQEKPRKPHNIDIVVVPTNISSSNCSFAVQIQSFLYGELRCKSNIKTLSIFRIAYPTPWLNSESCFAPGSQFGRLNAIKDC